MKKKYEILILFAIVSLATFLRFYNLGEPSCFNDELETWRIAKYGTLTEMFKEGIIPDVHPPGYQILMHFVVHQLGDSEFWLRLPSAIAGIFSIIMIFILGKFLYSSKEGLIAASLSAILWTPLYYSQEARAYSLLFLFSIITTYYWLKIISELSNERKPKITWLIIYILSSVFIEYLLYLGLFLIILQGISSFFILRKQKNSLSLMFKIFGIIAVAFLPWLPFALEQFAVGVEWVKKPTVLAFGYFIAFLFNLSPWMITLLIAIFIFWIIHTIKRGFFKNGLFIPPDIFLFIWLFLPITLILIKSILSSPILTYYSLMISAPAAYILLARGIAILKIREKYNAVISIAIILIFLLDLFYEVNYYEEPYKNKVEVFGKSFTIRSKQMFREAAQYVKSFDSKYPNSIIISYAWFPDYFQYYFDQIGYDREVDINVWNVKDTLKLRDLSEKFPDDDYIWVLRGHKTYDSTFGKWMKDNFVLIHHEPMTGADVWLYKVQINIK